MAIKVIVRKYNLDDVPSDELVDELVKRGYIRAILMQEDIRPNAEDKKQPITITDEDDDDDVKLRCT